MLKTKVTNKSSPAFCSLHLFVLMSETRIIVGNYHRIPECTLYNITTAKKQMYSNFVFGIRFVETAHTHTNIQAQQCEYLSNTSAVHKAAAVRCAHRFVRFEFFFSISLFCLKFVLGVHQTKSFRCTPLPNLHEKNVRIETNI